VKLPGSCQHQLLHLWEIVHEECTITAPFGNALRATQIEVNIICLILSSPVATVLNICRQPGWHIDKPQVKPEHAGSNLDDQHLQGNSARCCYNRNTSC
jgi:hypothetical protein